MGSLLRNKQLLRNQSLLRNQLLLRNQHQRSQLPKKVGRKTNKRRSQEKMESNRLILAMANNDTISFEYYNARSHAWHGGFGFGSSVDGLWEKPYSGISFFNLFHCSSARMTEKNLAAMMAIGSVHGPAATGCTHAGAMLCNHVFE